MGFKGFVVVCALIGVLWLALAGAASATVTRSSLRVVSPRGDYLLDDEVTPAEGIQVSGTSDGVQGDQVDVNCYFGDVLLTLTRDVAVGPDGSFSTSAGSLGSIAGNRCVLRAVPSGDTSAQPPGSSSPFTGPTVSIDERRNSVNRASGKLYDYGIFASQSKGGFDYGSLGACTVDESETYDPVTLVRRGSTIATPGSARGTA